MLESVPQIFKLLFDGPWLSNSQTRRRRHGNHTCEAALDVAEIVSREKLFWGPGSTQRQRWLEEYHGLTNSLTGFEFKNWKALHVAASVGFLHLVTALLNEGHREEAHEYNSLHSKSVSLLF